MKKDILAYTLLAIVVVIAVLLNIGVTHLIVEFLKITNEGAVSAIHTVIAIFEFLALVDLVND